MKLGNAFAVALAIATWLTSLPANAADPVALAYQDSYTQEAANDAVAALATLEKIPPARRGYVFHLRRGWLLYLCGRHPEAVTAYEAAIELAPRAVEPKLGVMLPLMALRRWQDAGARAEEILRLAPGTVQAERRLAFCLFNLGRFADAERHYRAVVDRYPADAEMIAGVGWSLLKQGRTADAKKAFEEVLAFAPNDPAASSGLAEVSRAR